MSELWGSFEGICGKCEMHQILTKPIFTGTKVYTCCACQTPLLLNILPKKEEEYATADS